MATSGDCYSNYARNTRFRVHWERTNYWSNNNDCGSNIKWILYLENGNYWYSNAIRCNSIYINGSEVYSGGTWSNYTSSGTYELASGTTSVKHNNDGTKTFNINFSGWFYSSYDVSGSQDFNLDTIPRYANFTSHYIKSKSINTATISWTADSSIDSVQYSLNGGTWTNTSGSTYTINNLEPNTTYNIKTKIRRSDSKLWQESKTISVTTYNIAKLTEVPDVNIGEAQTIAWTNPGYAATTLKLVQLDGTSIEEYDTVEGTSKTITADANTIYNLTPNSNTYVARYILTSEQNGKSYTDYKDFKFIVTDSNPIFTDFNYSVVINADNLTGSSKIIIKGYSTIVVDIGMLDLSHVIPFAKAINGATMKSYKLVIGNNSTQVEHPTSSMIYRISMTLRNVENENITVYAIDSRGNTTAVTKKAVIKNYSDLVIKSVTAERLENGVSKNATLKFNGTYWNENFGRVDNEIKSIKYYYKETNASEWIEGSTELSVATSENEWSGSASIKGDLEAEGFDVSKSYDIRLEVTDCLVTKTYDVVLGTGTPALAIYKNKVAQGKKYDTELGGDFQMNGEVFLNGKKLPENYVKAIDNLTSTSTIDALSANQGKVLNEKIEKLQYRYIKATISSVQNVREGSTVNLNQIVEDTTGGLITLSNNGLVIGTGISQVEVSGLIFAQNVNGNSGQYIWHKIYKNGTTSMVGNICPATTHFVSGVIPPVPINVTTGDKITMLADNTSSTGELRAGAENTYLLIRIIE